MRQVKPGLLAFALCVCVGNVEATMVNDGVWDDWFSYGGDTALDTWDENDVLLTSLNIRTLIDEEGPTPGGGGQAYDIEQIFFSYEDFDPNALTGGLLHFGLVTGFNPTGENGAGGPHYAGDLFLQLANEGDYSIAVAVGTENTPENDGGARFGQAWANSGAPNWTLLGVNTIYATSNPYRVDEDADGAIPYPDGVQVNWGREGVHSFLEVTMDVDAALEVVLLDPLNSGFRLHWTMECGNDEIDARDETPCGFCGPADPEPGPVPEPGTIVLLGMGTAGIALRVCRARA